MTNSKKLYIDKVKFKISNKFKDIDDIINIKNLDPNKIRIDEKS